MNTLFKQWNERVKPSEKKKVSEASLTSIDRNSKNLLNNILMTNKRYLKEEIPSAFKYNDETSEFEPFDVTKAITPFVTSKEDLFESLEIERENYLAQQVAKKELANQKKTDKQIPKVKKST
jgi:23S rRNA A1618 N6-methylase RlmF